jgi:Domain of unknown function (DUF4340)
MIKKSTLIVLLCAVVLGGGVYFYQQRQAKDNGAPKETSKPAFSFQPEDVTSFTLSHPAEPNHPAIRFEKHGGSWQIVQPVQTGADQSTVQGIVDQVAEARVGQTEPGSPDRRKVYGLDPPQTTLELQLKNGARHTLLIGDKDFTGDSVYTIADNGQNVSLLPVLISTSTSKSLDDLRDRSVLNIESGDVTGLALKNPSGEITADLNKDQWKLTKPENALADKSAIDMLVSAVSNAKMTAVVSEKPENMGKYGLGSPSVSFTATTNKGAKSSLIVGKKEGEEYYARDLSRPIVFRINDDLYKKLTEKFSDLRDKRVMHFDAEDIGQVEIENANGTVTVARKKDNPDEWAIRAPDNLKGKSAGTWKFLDPISNLQADEVIDHPAANLTSEMAKPEITATLTKKDGSALTLRISKPSGDFVYAQASDSPALYKLKKQAIDDLNFKPADLAL